MNCIKSKSQLTKLVVSAILLFPLSLFSQVVAHKTVELKNGSIFRGVVYMESIDTIRLLTEEDHILVFARKDIVKLEKSPNRHSLYTEKMETSKNWYSTTNFLVDFDWLDQLGFGVESYFGLKHHQRFQNGIGVGFKLDIDGYDYEPFTGHIAIQNRVNLQRFGSTPFVTYEPAYLLMFKSDYYGKPLYKPFAHSVGIGYRYYKPRKGRSFNVSMLVQRRKGLGIRNTWDVTTNTFTRTLGDYSTEYRMIIQFGFQI